MGYEVTDIVHHDDDKSTLSSAEYPWRVLFTFRTSIKYYAIEWMKELGIQEDDYRCNRYCIAFKNFEDSMKCYLKFKV